MNIDKTKKNEPMKRTDHNGAADSAANLQNIARHKKAAAHHIEAAKHHMEVVRNRENGDHEKAAHNTILAYGHSAIAGQFLNDDAKHHAQTLKETKYR